jgi:chorismate mutase
MTAVRKPHECTSMLDVEAGLDDTDRRIFTLLMVRFAYSTVAARIQADRSKISDKRHIVGKLRRLEKDAREHGLDPHFVKRIYTELFEASIEHRRKVFKKLQIPETR